MLTSTKIKGAALFEKLKNVLGKRPRAPEPTSSTSPNAFLDGAYRLHKSEDVERFTALAIRAFPELSTRVTCFGADWLGRQFALDSARVVVGEQQVLLLEPGTGEMLQIPADYSSFHTDELVHEADTAVAYGFFHKWRSAGGLIPAYDQCVGYRRPLFLGGEDEVSNLELCDFELYWDISAQLLEQVRGLPRGTPITGMSIND